ncbi:hypothetical protein V6N13_079904 [Hibiscus sabdariffa]
MEEEEVSLSLTLKSQFFLRFCFISRRSYQLGTLQCNAKCTMTVALLLSFLPVTPSWAMSLERRLGFLGPYRGRHSVRLASQSSDNFPLLAVEGLQTGVSWI